MVKFPTGLPVCQSSFDHHFPHFGFSYVLSYQTFHLIKAFILTYNLAGDGEVDRDEFIALQKLWDVPEDKAGMGFDKLTNVSVSHASACMATYMHPLANRFSRMRMS